MIVFDFVFTLFISEPLHLPWLVKPAVNLYSGDCYYFKEQFLVCENDASNCSTFRKKGGYKQFFDLYSQLHIVHMQYTQFEKRAYWALIFLCVQKRKVKCNVRYMHNTIYLVGMHTWCSLICLILSCSYIFATVLTFECTCLRFYLQVPIKLYITYI